VYDYVSKPLDPDELTQLVRNAVEKRRLALENVRLRQNIDSLIAVDNIVGRSPQIRLALEKVAAVAQTESTVMIRGESGTGKELIARSIHGNSPRRYAPIISVNCGASTETLLESDLFGHEKGAFTGAQHRRKGKLEQANKGTIFLDEIGTISPKMQVDLLRVVETKRFTRLGGEDPIEVDFRIISATNRNLEDAVADGSFREDLYFRLNVVSIEIPPLRERDGDVPLLAHHFMEHFSRSMNKPLEGISDEAMLTLTSYEWPGNVRELRNVIERAAVVCKGSRIDADDLSFPFRTRPTLGESLEDVEKAHIGRILERTEGNISQAAQILKIDRTTLYAKIKKYGFGRP
jgi:two-component system response regulator HydG